MNLKTKAYREGQKSRMKSATFPGRRPRKEILRNLTEASELF